MVLGGKEEVARARRVQHCTYRVPDIPVLRVLSNVLVELALQLLLLLLVEPMFLVQPTRI